MHSVLQAPYADGFGDRVSSQHPFWHVASLTRHGLKHIVILSLEIHADNGSCIDTIILCIIDNPGTNPWIWVIVLVEVSDSSTACESRNCGI